MTDTVKHSTLSGTENHAIHVWEYANEAARLAAVGFAATDAKKLALQLDDMSYHVLASHDPVTWVAVGSGSAGPATVPPPAQVLLADYSDPYLMLAMHTYAEEEQAMVEVTQVGFALGVLGSGSVKVKVTGIGVLDQDGTTYAEYGLAGGIWIRGNYQSSATERGFSDGSKDYMLELAGDGATTLLVSANVYYKASQDSITPLDNALYVLRIEYDGNPYSNLVEGRGVEAGVSPAYEFSNDVIEQLTPAGRELSFYSIEDGTKEGEFYVLFTASVGV